MKSDKLELLISHNPKLQSQSGLSGRVKWYGALLILGLTGTALCLWTMFYTPIIEGAAHDLGMTRVANSLENVLDVLAYPALMFTVVLSVYAMQRLYRIYRQANDPGLGKRGQA